MWNVSRDVCFSLLLGLHSSGRINTQILWFLQPSRGTEKSSQKYCSFIYTEMTVIYLFALGQGRGLISKVLTSSHKLADCLVPIYLAKNKYAHVNCWLADLQWPQGYGVRFIWKVTDFKFLSESVSFWRMRKPQEGTCRE